MRAWVWDGDRLQLEERPEPRPGPGQAVLDVLAAGLCHSDLSLMARGRTGLAYPLPTVFGHEAAGRVIEVGPDVDPALLGCEVAVYGPRGCGECRACRSGAQQYCAHARPRGIFSIGIGHDGALADRLLAPDAADLVPLRGLAPQAAAPLTDAGLTTYSAIELISPRLHPGATALVIGAGGGLGHLAVQWLRARGDVDIIALERSPTGRALLGDLGVQTVLADASELEALRRLTADGAGASAVIDLVGNQTTVELASSFLAQDGQLAIVGLGGGLLPVGLGSVPFGTTIHTPYWGSRGQLERVLTAGREGVVSPTITEYAFEDVPAAYEDLRNGRVLGRAVVRPVAE